MEFNIKLLDRIIENAESLDALSMSVEVGEHKGWSHLIIFRRSVAEVSCMRI